MRCSRETLLIRFALLLLEMKVQNPCSVCLTGSRDDPGKWSDSKWTRSIYYLLKVYTSQICILKERGIGIHFFFFSFYAEIYVNTIFSLYIIRRSLLQWRSLPEKVLISCEFKQQFPLAKGGSLSFSRGRKIHFLLICECSPRDKAQHLQLEHFLQSAMEHDQHYNEGLYSL